MERYPDYGRAIRLAYRTLLHLEITQLPVDIVAICRRLKNTRILSYTEAEEKAASLYIRLLADGPSDTAFTCRMDHPSGQAAYLILYNDDPYQNPARLRFTLAHELGHIVMRHKDGGYAQEAEADTFAQHLLCPEPVLAALRENASAWMLGRVFGLSITAARAILEEKKRDFYVRPAHHAALRAAFGLAGEEAAFLTRNMFESMLTLQGL